MKVTGGIEPEVELLLPVALPLSVYIGVEDVRVPTQVSQELKVDLVVGWSFRRQLHHKYDIEYIMSRFLYKGSLTHQSPVPKRKRRLKTISQYFNGGHEMPTYNPEQLLPFCEHEKKHELYHP